MAKLNLNFLNNPHKVDQPNLISILENFGKEISDYGSDYFSHIVTTASNEGVLSDFSLYILAPEIGYDYKVINVEILSVKDLKISFHTLLTKQTETCNLDISKGTFEYEKKLAELLSNNLFNTSLQFIVEQILLKRSSNFEVITQSEIRNHIKSDVTVLKDLILYGVITGNVLIVSPWTIKIIGGIVHGNINIQTGAKLILNGGIVQGTINNEGSFESTGGIVEGQLIGNGKSIFGEDSIININGADLPN